MSDTSRKTYHWTRRAWLGQSIAAALVATRASTAFAETSQHPREIPRTRTQSTTDREKLAQHAVDAARRAGAQYAEARLTRTEQHHYSFSGTGIGDREEVGVGVRALVNGYWGFAAAPSGDTDAVEQLARAAVAQAAVNARGSIARTVDLGQIPVARGTWTTPIEIDPFTVPIEEKRALMKYWGACAAKEGLYIDVLVSYLHFVRQERVVATSDGACFTQIVYESGGDISVRPFDNPTLERLAREGSAPLPIQGIETTGRGWELLLTANVPEQIRAMPAQMLAADALLRGATQATIGRYTLVCDGATVAALLSATVGAATQLDRALGYEANASGTSFLDDPLAMLGTFRVASSLVTVTANRSIPAQLGTIKWDDEGVVPSDIHLVKNGILTDFQTTREQAAWLAPYYAKTRGAVHSNGCAATENALGVPLQQMPNLSLESGPSAIRLEDLVVSVKDGILIERSAVAEVDSQARTGMLFSPSMRKITNGKLGSLVQNGVVLFNTLELWKNVIAVGGPSTQAVMPFSQYPNGGQWGQLFGKPVKGEPAQLTSHSVQASAVTITNQTLIDPRRKA